MENQCIEYKSVWRDDYLKWLCGFANANVHRDYSTGIPIQIKIYDNKIVIYNDGMLPDNWDINDLLNAHRSRPHNPFIANTFFRSGQIEAWGRGIDRIKEECQRFETEEPVFKSKGCDVVTTFEWDNAKIETINTDNDIVSGTINGTVNDENGIVNDKNDIVNDENGIVNDENGIVNDENDIVNLKDIPNIILQIIAKNENISAFDIAKKIGKSWRTTMRYLETLKKENKIEYYGAPKTGGYRIIEQK